MTKKDILLIICVIIICTITLLMKVDNQRYNKFMNEKTTELTYLNSKNEELNVKLRNLEEEYNYLKNEHANKEKSIIASYIQNTIPTTPRIVREKIAEEMYTQAKANHLPYSLLMGIAWVESRFDPTAVSNKKARGLMQILDKQCCKKDIDQNKIHDIDYNIECGICIFMEKMRIAKGDLNKALLGYVGGKEDYADDVLRAMGKFMLYRNHEMNKVEEEKENVKNN